jgi:hypothetical protein
VLRKIAEADVQYLDTKSPQKRRLIMRFDEVAVDDLDPLLCRSYKSMRYGGSCRDPQGKIDHLLKTHYEPKRNCSAFPELQPFALVPHR